MSSEISLLAIFSIGLVAGFINVIVGSGSSIMIPALIFLGLPGKIAIATNRIAMLFNNGTGALLYYRKGRLDLRTALIISFFAMVGAYIGATLLVKIDKELLAPIIASILLIEAVVVIFGPRKMGLEDETFQMTKKNLIYGAVAGFIVGTYGGFIGMAMTSILIFIFVALFGITFIKSAAIAKVLTFVISVTASIVFLKNFDVDPATCIILAVAYVIGASIGVRSAIQMGDVRVKWVFVIVVILSAAKLFFF
ncbi:MAG: hypothetical protein COW88_02345 [Candidatus Lloydbacteria bacterium CG22_combo_CG10-13_8_21_14_all_47_15]|uniref:Probable membrane transporter protein n=1 Tax=Candidatus Lloydbacteria bacterium CG22_combo_CG10-13_8_21_14_all_47_15 TaxID=1974635 RepID=A0A2H0CTV6_9BACT|nr:MAG: hypothetical protein COW88_02345 [Candidatus Lloydbacteria bacterium CG22_combo_CG10-13_8_21_14_all_47_15]